MWLVYAAMPCALMQQHRSPGRRQVMVGQGSKSWAHSGRCLLGTHAKLCMHITTVQFVSVECALVSCT